MLPTYNMYPITESIQAAASAIWVTGTLLWGVGLQNLQTGQEINDLMHYGTQIQGGVNVLKGAIDAIGNDFLGYCYASA